MQCKVIALLVWFKGIGLLVHNYFQFFAPNNNQEYYINIILILYILVWFEGIGLLVPNYFQFFSPNTHCALVIALSEKQNKYHYGYREWGTHARVFPQTLAHGNSKNEIKIKKRTKKV